MEKRNGNIKPLIKGILTAAVATLVLVLIVAVIIRFSGMSDTPIAILAQVIKVLSIFFGVAIATKGIAKGGWIHGIFVGIGYTAIAFLMFGILDNSFNLTAGFLNDLLLSTIIGAISAIILKMGRRDAM